MKAQTNQIDMFSADEMPFALTPQAVRVVCGLVLENADGQIPMFATAEVLSFPPTERDLMSRPYWRELK